VLFAITDIFKESGEPETISLVDKTDFVVGVNIETRHEDDIVNLFKNEKIPYTFQTKQPIAETVVPDLKFQSRVFTAYKMLHHAFEAVDRTDKSKSSSPFENFWLGLPASAHVTKYETASIESRAFVKYLKFTKHVCAPSLPPMLPPRNFLNFNNNDDKKLQMSVDSLEDLWSDPGPASSHNKNKSCDDGDDDDDDDDDDDGFMGIQFHALNTRLILQDVAKLWNSALFIHDDKIWTGSVSPTQYRSF
jgi:hypothetical protein